MVRVSAAAIVLLFLASGSAAQVGPSGGIVVDLGLLRRGQSDRAASPLRYTGTIPTFGLSYSGDRLGGRLEIGAVFATGDLSSGITASGLPHEDAWVGRIGVRYLRPVARKWGGRLALLAGGQLAAHGSFRVHHYVEDGTESFADVLAPLQIAGGWDWGPGPMHAGQRLAVPIAGLVMRNPYGGLKYVPPVEIALPGELVGLDHELFVDRSAGRLALRVTWSFVLLRHPDPREIRLAEHRLTLGAVVRPGATQ